MYVVSAQLGKNYNYTGKDWMNKHQNIQLFGRFRDDIYFFLYKFSYFPNFLQQIFIAFISKLTISIKTIIPLKCIKRSRSMEQNIKSSIRSKYILELEYYKSGILNQRRKDTRFSKLHGNNQIATWKKIKLDPYYCALYQIKFQNGSHI